MNSFRPRNFSECIGALWCRRWLILGVTGVVLLSSFLVIRRIPDVYESRAVVVVADHEENGLVTSGQVAAVSEQLTSRNTLEPIIKKYGLYRPILDNAGMDVAVAQMRKAIAVQTTFRREFPESLTIVFRDSDPSATRGVLEDLVANFYAANDAIRRQAEADIASVNAEIATIDQQLDGLDRVRSDSARRTAASRREFDAMTATRAQRAAAASSIDALTSQQQLLTAQIAALRQQVKDQEELVASLPATPVEAGALAVRRAELLARLNEFAGQYTDKNPKVISAREELAEVDRQIAAAAAGAAPATQRSASPEAAELRTLRRDLAGRETELEVTTKELARRSAGALQAPVESALARSADALPAEADGGYDRLRIRYQALMNRQDALERALPAAFVGQGVFRVVDTPATPDTPIGPSRLLLALFALGLALGVAFVVAAALEARRMVRIQDDLDISYFLGAPVLAAIPETLTPVEAQSRRSLRLLRGAGLAVVTVALVPALFGLMSALQIFELLARR